jgi:hypothetical protein
MRNILLVLSILPSFLITNQAFAIDEKYRHQLEQSGCTQLSELQGCDIRKSKSKQENIKAGFVENNTQDALEGKRSIEPHWIAERTDGKILARIKIDDKERVWVNDYRVIAIKKKGQLTFRQGKINYTIFTDLEKGSESFWYDRYSKDKGKIVLQ